MKSKVVLFDEILKEEFCLYQRKAMDYGTSPVEKTGIVGLMVRIIDKTERVFNLSKTGRVALVKNEALEDTLMDIANYANMALVELRLGRERTARSGVPDSPRKGKQASEPVGRRKTLLDIITSTVKQEYGRMDKFGAWSKTGT